MAPTSRLRPRLADRVYTNMAIPRPYLEWLDSQRTELFPTRAAVIRNLIASAMKSQDRHAA